MRRTLISLLLAVMHAQVFAAESINASQANVIEHIEHLARERSRALVRRDVATLDRILAPAFVYTNASGELSDKAACLRRMTDPGVTWISQEIEDIEVRLSGDTAVLTAAVHDRASFGGDTLDARFRSTFVYVRNATGWYCVAGHTSPVSAAD